MLLRYLGPFFALILVTASARAEWHEASSDHFLIYADQKAEQVQFFAERLERYHSAMQFLLRREDRKPSPSNRVMVFAVKNKQEVQKFMGGDNRFAAGFYVPRAGGTFAFVPRIETGESNLQLSGERVLLHEYAHHVMYGSNAFRYPLWFTEGFAEFYGAAGFEKDGSVGLGRPAANRLAEMKIARNVPIELLLDSKAYIASKADQKGFDEFYGRSWLLFHYLSFSPERKGQLAQFVMHLSDGKTDIDSARAAFGDLKTLDLELKSYALRKRLSYWELKPAALKISEIRMRKLDEGEAAIMPVRMRSRRGVDELGAKELLPQAQAIAAQYPSNAAVLAALSQAEFDAGNDDAAIKAADAATKLEPGNVHAMIRKGYALARKAKTAADPDKAWSAARLQFLKANKIENDHPAPLIGYFATYVSNGEEPTDNALAGYDWALQLAPFDKNLRMSVALAFLNKRKFDDAIITLQPLTTDSHNQKLSSMAQALIEKAEEVKAGIGAADVAKKALPPTQ